MVSGEGHLDDPSPASSHGPLLYGSIKPITTGFIRAFILPLRPPGGLIVERKSIPLLASIRGVKGREALLYYVYPPAISGIYGIIVKPRSDLEIEHPYEVRTEQ
ncbi:MAG: hypothetical protein QXO04_03510 [Nitrososphaerota archaeon]